MFSECGIVEGTITTQVNDKAFPLHNCKWVNGIIKRIKNIYKIVQDEAP